jgi:hypothetical protein
MKKVHKKLITLVAHYVNDSGESETFEDLSEALSNMGGTAEQTSDVLSLCDILENNASEATCSPEEHNEPEWQTAFEKLVILLSTVMELNEDEVSIALEDKEVSFPYEQWEEGLELKNDDEEDSDDEDEETDEEE